MELLVITGFLFLLALNAAVQEVITDKAWPRHTLKYVIWSGVPFIGFAAMYLGA